MSAQYISRIAANDESLTKVTFHSAFDVPRLCAALKQNTVLRALLLPNSPSVTELSSALLGALHHHPALVKLRFFCSSEAVPSFVRLLNANHYLEWLYLGGGSLGDEGCALICEALRHHPSVSKLSLWNSKLTAVAARSVADLLRTNKNLQVLELGDNAIGDEGQLITEAMCVNESLKELYLSRCGLTDACVPSLVKLITHNTTLTTLWMYGNKKFSVKGHKALVDALEHNVVLTEFDCELEYRSDLRKKAASFLKRNNHLVNVRAKCTSDALIILLGMRKLHMDQCGILFAISRDVLRYIFAPILWATRGRVCWSP